MTHKTRTISYAFLMILASFLFSGKAMAATLNVISDMQSVNIGDQFSVNIKVDTEGKSVNAAQATVKFSKDILEAVSVDKSGSVFNFWLDDPFISNPSGTASFTAGSTNGFSGKSLQVLKITFKVKGNGTADISLTNSAVTSSDGSGANVLSKTNGVKIASGTDFEPSAVAPSATPAGETIPIIVSAPTQITRPATIASNLPAKPEMEVPFFPDQTSWYNNSDNFLVKWKLPSDISAVSTEINHDPNFSPVKSEGLFGDKIFKAPDNGISYVHIRFKNNIGWGSATHYKISIDTIPPTPFEIKVAEQNPTDVPNPTIRYSSGDQLSGLDHYSIRVDDGEVVSTKKSSYTLPLLPPGDHIVRVSAEDKAQNITEGTITLKILPVSAPAIRFTSKVYVNEGNFYASGITPSGTTLIFSLKNSNGESEYRTEITPDKDGGWTASIDKPLKKDNYYVEVLAEDSRGALSFPVKSDVIKVRPRPLFTVFGIGITQFWFYMLSLLILGGAFFAGIKTEKHKKDQRGRRTLIAQRDTTNLLEMIKKDLNSIIEHKCMKKLSPKETSEIGFSTDRISKSIKKMEDYVMKDIEEINN